MKVKKLSTKAGPLDRAPRREASNGESSIARGQRLRLSTLYCLSICLFLGAFLVRAGFVLTLEDRLYWPDERDFVNIARGLALGEGYQSAPKRANPILSVFLASIYRLVGYGYLAPRLMQSAIGALGVAIVFALARRLYNTRVALLAGAGAALYPPLIYICGVFYVECLFTTLMALSIYLLHLSSQSRGYLFLILLTFSGAVTGIAVLCRPIFLVFLPFAVLFIVSSYPGSSRRKIASAMALVLIASLTILPWTLRNYDVYNRALLVATGSGLFLWRGNNELAKGDTDDRYLDPGVGDVWIARLQELPPDRQKEVLQKYSNVQHDLEALDGIDQDKYLQRVALAFIRDHPVQSLALFLQKVRTLYTGFTEVRPEHRGIIGSKRRLAMSLIFYPVLVLGIFGMGCGLRQWRKYLILYLPIVSLTLAYGVLTSATRFRIPLEPYLLIFASYGSVVLFGSMRTTRYGTRHAAAS